MDKQRKPYDDDDGHTIADMNVDGMPWYDARRTGSRGKLWGGAAEPMSFRQRLSACGGILAAIAAVTVVFGGAYYLVILLMDIAWR